MQSLSSDIELWNAFINGDKGAFSDLFRRFYPLLFQYGIKIVSDAEVVEDAIQELFLDIWQKPTTQPLQSVQAYLLQALKFKLYKTFRTRKHSVYGDGDHVFVLSQETIHIIEDEHKEQAKKILSALEQLTPRQKEVIYLKIYKGLSYDEVSSVMGINYQVVRNLLYTALKAFRELYAAIVLPAIVCFF